MKAVDEIVALSRHYGQGHDWVIAGGGNTSIKDGDVMWVKASGTQALATMTADQFVAMNRTALGGIWKREYPRDADAREQQALADLMAARQPSDGEEPTEPADELRPSVETLMHALFPQRLVVHTHPTLLNGLTCAKDGQAALERLFGTEALWIPVVDPGYTLAKEMHGRIESWREVHDGAWPQIVVMQNHGLVVAAETAEEIHALHDRIDRTMREAIGRRPELTPERRDTDELREPAEAVARALAEMHATAGAALERPVVTSFSNPEILRRAASEEAMEPISSAFSPDHIVYSGHKPCYVHLPDVSLSPHADQVEILHAVHEYVDREGSVPKVVVLRGRGAVAVTPTERKTEIARRLFLNALEIACYAESFGGSRFMPAAQIEFVRGWEVERFREQQSTA